MNILQTINYQDFLIVNTIIRFNTNHKHYLKIAFLQYGSELPDYCSTVKFSPKPQNNLLVNDNLYEVMSNEYSLNPSIHDGAIGFGFIKESTLIHLKFWGVRLFPPDLSGQYVLNRGMAYNSSIHFSMVRNINKVYLFSKDKVSVFQKGYECDNIYLL